MIATPSAFVWLLLIYGVNQPNDSIKFKPAGFHFKNQEACTTVLEQVPSQYKAVCIRLTMV